VARDVWLVRPSFAFPLLFVVRLLFSRVFVCSCVRMEFLSV
jgi:hypothetical protein